MANRPTTEDRDRSQLDAPSRSLQVRLVRFLIVGGMGALVNTSALYLLHQRAHLPLVLASALAVELSIANGFFWNDRWTFQRAHGSFARFFQFNIVSLGGLAITSLTLWVLATFASVEYLTANLAAIAVATTWNFMVNLLWTWR